MAAAFLPTSSASVLSLLGLGTFEPEKLRGKALYRKRVTERNFLCKKPQGKPLVSSAIPGGVSRGKKESGANVMVCANRMPQAT